MAIVMGCDVSSKIPAPSNGAVIFQGAKHFPQISSISLMEISVLIWLEPAQKGEGGGTAISFDLMGNVSARLTNEEVHLVRKQNLG